MQSLESVPAQFVLAFAKCGVRRLAPFGESRNRKVARGGGFIPSGCSFAPFGLGRVAGCFNFASQ
jgi:hypothetical protein